MLGRTLSPPARDSSRDSRGASCWSFPQTHGHSLFTVYGGPSAPTHPLRREEAHRRAAEAQGQLGTLDEEARRKEAEAADLDRQLEALKKEAATAEHRR